MNIQRSNVYGSLRRKGLMWFAPLFVVAIMVMLAACPSGDNGDQEDNRPSATIDTVTLTNNPSGSFSDGAMASIELVSITGSPVRAYWAIVNNSNTTQPDTEAVKTATATPINMGRNIDFDNSAYGVDTTIESNRATHTIDIRGGILSTTAFDVATTTTYNIYVVLTRVVGDLDDSMNGETDDIDSMLIMKLNVPAMNNRP